jgi:hypothetical protein
MAHLDLTQPQALLLAQVLRGTLAGPAGSTGTDWRAVAPELAAVTEALDRLTFNTRSCPVCGAAFEALNPRRTTCSDRCRQVLSRSKRAGRPIPAPQPGQPAAAPAPESSISEGLAALRAQRAPVWEQLQADAKRCGCKPERVQRFRADHAIKPGSPLTDAAADQLRHELEQEAAAATGRRQWAAERLQAIEALPDSSLRALAALVTAAPITGGSRAALAYLKSARADLQPGQWDSLQREIEARCPAVPATISHRALFFGLLLRLPDLGPMPTDPAAVAEWSGLALQRQHRQRVEAGATGLGDLLNGRMSANTTREVLGLPLGVELTSAAIHEAYRAKAGVEHPDKGGDVERFHRVQEARKRLLEMG